MKYNLAAIMRHAWALRRMSRQTFPTCLRLAWAEAKGLRAYPFRLEDAHQQHKYEALWAALLAPVDIQGVAVLDGKTIGLCKYALRNA